jgi:Holliday junction resolvasome RuvABC ATP-dependent DNA helicase subunit
MPDEPRTSSFERDDLRADPDSISSIAELGRQLRLLRIASGAPTLRELEKRATSTGGHLPRSTAGNAESGKHLPRLEVIQIFVRACNGSAADVSRWQAAWQRLYARRYVVLSAGATAYPPDPLSEHETSRYPGGLPDPHQSETRLAAAIGRAGGPQDITDLEATVRSISQGTLELMSTRVSFAADVAGMPAVRLALTDAQRAGHHVLRILLAGPPGTGKTLAAGAIASALNVPAVRYGEIFNEYVGVADRNMARANRALRAMAPVVLFVDEADQTGLRARGASSSNEVYQHLRAAMFEFLDDTGEQTGITVVATTNVPGSLDEPLLSRFTVLPVLFPSAAELAQVITINARRLGIALDGDLTAVLTEYTTGGGVLSGRSAVQVLEAAHVQVLRTADTVVTTQHIRDVLDSWIGNDWTPATEISILSSLLWARHADALPWIAARHLGEHYEIPAYMQPYVAENGNVDVGLMRKRLAELSPPK